MSRAYSRRTLQSALSYSRSFPRSPTRYRRFYSSLGTQDGQNHKPYDVVVVGSGCSGLTTAVVAAKHGLKVLVLEKTKFFGGTTAYSGGGAWIPNNKHQAAIGIKDNEEDARRYLKQVLGDLYEQEKTDAYIQTAPKMVEWMESNSEVTFKPVPLPDYHVAKPGASAGRTILTAEFDGRRLGAFVKNVRYPIQGYSALGSMQADPAELAQLTKPFSSVGNFVHCVRRILRYALDLARYGKGAEMANGNALVGRLLYTARQLGVDLQRNSPAIAPVVGSDGRVEGLRIRDGQTNKETTVLARRGVVLASGGFPRSKEAEEFVPHEWSAACPGNTGDGKRIGTQAGGALPPKNPMNAIFAPISLLHVSSGPVRRFPHFAIDRSKPGSIIVGPDGQRFANESAPYQEFVATMHAKGVKKAYYIGDRTHLRKYGMGVALPWPYPIWKVLRQGYLISAPTISALAEKINVPAATLRETVAEYNEFAKTGKDVQFQRGENAYDRFYGDPEVGPNPNLRPCETGPFYALPVHPGNVSTMYGFKTNVDAQVLQASGEVIDGLYAVGCDQNSVFKGAYPGGGSSIGPGMTFGYRAGLKLAGVK